MNSRSRLCRLKSDHRAVAIVTGHCHRAHCLLALEIVRKAEEMPDSLAVGTELAVVGDTLLDIARAQKSHTQQEPLVARNKVASVEVGKAAADVDMGCALPEDGAVRQGRGAVAVAYRENPCIDVFLGFLLILAHRFVAARRVVDRRLSCHPFRLVVYF